MSYGKSRGRHRRKGRGQTAGDARSVQPFKRRASDQRAERDPLHQGGSLADDLFTAMACEHPEGCSCDDDYPGWAPGQR